MAFRCWERYVKDIPQHLITSKLLSDFLVIGELTIEEFLNLPSTIYIKNVISERLNDNLTDFITNNPELEKDIIHTKNRNLGSVKTPRSLN